MTATIARVYARIQDQSGERLAERRGVRPPRDLRLDILRGWMQISIFVAHCVGSVMSWGIHAAWGISDSSEQFVLLSGMLLGSVFKLKEARGDGAGARRDIYRRTWKLWQRHVVVVVLMAAFVLFLERTLGLDSLMMRLGWGWMFEAPQLAIPAAAAMLYQPDKMGILPIFVLCMAALAPFLWLCARIGAWALTLPVALYACVTLGWPAPPPWLVSPACTTNAARHSRGPCRQGKKIMSAAGLNQFSGWVMTAEAGESRSDRDMRWSALMAAAQDGGARAYDQLLRECLPMLRSICRARGRRTSREIDIEHAGPIIDPSLPPAKRGLERAELRAALRDLPSSRAKALQLAKIEELFLSEASARSGLSVGALEVAKHRALATLRKRLGAP